MATEWTYQDAYQGLWQDDGLVLDGKRFALITDELTTEWGHNIRGVPNQCPSVDFLFVDAAGKLSVMEMKRSVKDLSEAIRLLAQVSYCAVAAALYMRGRPVRSLLEARFEEYYQPETTAKNEPKTLDQLLESKLRTRPARFSRKLYRMVAALEYGEAFAEARVAFETRDPTELVRFLKGCGACSQKDVARLVELLAADPGAWEAVGGEITVVKIAKLCSELA